MIWCHGVTWNSKLGYHNHDHNRASCEGHVVIDHRYLDCLFNSLFGVAIKPLMSLLSLCEGNPPVTVGYHNEGAVMHTVFQYHYNDVIMGAMASQITSLASVYSTVYSGAAQRKYQSSESLAFVWGIHRGPVNSPHKWPVTRKFFFHWMTSSCSDVFMKQRSHISYLYTCHYQNRALHGIACQQGPLLLARIK